MKEKQLWIRQAAVYTAEIKVGETWVEASGKAHQIPSDAELEARMALSNDAAISAVRVCELKTVQVKTVTMHEKSEAEVKVPKGMRRTDAEAPCPACARVAPVLTDGTQRWVACNPCARTLPV